MSKKMNDEIDAILNGTTSSILDKLEELKERIDTSHERYWTREINGPDTNLQRTDIFNLDKPLDALKALSFDDTLTIADRLVLTIIWNEKEVTTDLVIHLTCMSPAGTRRCLKKLTNMGYIVKVKNALYAMSNLNIY